MAISFDQLPELSPEAQAEYLPQRMGIKIVSTDPDRLVGTMPVAGNRQPYGLLHGGASAVLAETLGSIAAALHALPDRYPVGVELSCTHHRAAAEGLVTGVATPLHIGRTTSTFAIEVTDERQRRICTARLTCVNLEAVPSSRQAPSAKPAQPPTASPR